MREFTTDSNKQAARPPASESLRAKAPKPNGKTKSGALRKLLPRPNAAAVAQLQKRLVWQPHTMRAAISRLRASGLTIELDQSGKVAR